MRATASLATKPYSKFNFRRKFSLLIVGPTQSGKTYFVQQILKHNRIVYEEQKSIRIFWYYKQWQECYEELKKSLSKSIRFEDLCEINPRYNNIILDDLMALWYLNCLRKVAMETQALSYFCKTCFCKTTSSRKLQTVTWSDVTNDVWENYRLGAPKVRKIHEGYVIIEMYTNSRNRVNPSRPGVEINDERSWPVKLKHRSTCHIKWVDLHEDEPTVQSIVKETMENTTKPIKNYCSD